MSRLERSIRIVFTVSLITLSVGCASLDRSDSFVARWSMRGVGALGAFALHEACHVAVGAAFGANIEASFRRGSLFLEFSDLKQNQHQAVSIAGNACTGLAAEVIVDTRTHKKSNLAWGAAVFHSINAFGYAFSHHGDADYWRDSGGTQTSWQVINATHSSRIGAQLAWDSEYGEYLKSRWRAGSAVLPAVSVAANESAASDDEATPLLLQGSETAYVEGASSDAPAAIDPSSD